MMLYCTLLDILGAIPLTWQLWRQMGQSLEAFGQWKAIVSLFFSCEAAPLHSRTQLFTKVTT